MGGCDQSSATSGLSLHLPILPWVSMGRGSLPTPHSAPTSQYVPCPFPQLLLPQGLVGSQREECLAPSQGRCPGRREAVRTRRGLLRIPAPTSLLGACQSGAGSPGEPLHRSQGGTGGAWGRAGVGGGVPQQPMDRVDVGGAQGPRAGHLRAQMGRLRPPGVKLLTLGRLQIRDGPCSRGETWGAQSMNRHHTSREEEGCLSGRLA